MTRLRIQAVPGAHESRVVGRHGDGWKVRIAAPPEAGKANDELVRLLAKLFGVHRQAVSVISGSGARPKLVEVVGVEFEAAAGLLDAASGK